MIIKTDIQRVLKQTSRTFAIPISLLPVKLQEPVASAYLCMRALDEIEDHGSLETQPKVALLRRVSANLQACTFSDTVQMNLILERLFEPFKAILPEVTLRLGDWLSITPREFLPRLVDASASMADRMAYWAERNWVVHDEADLDSYTFSVAGAVGLLISDIWAWYDGSQLDRVGAVNLGRGLQSVNILRNRSEDLKRNVDFFPPGWTEKEMSVYARKHLELVKPVLGSMPEKAYQYLVRIPFLLAQATLDAMEKGQSKLTRKQVLRIIAMDKI
jgi:farnesyl-diphosphate farnesyltransferase